jgi:hypothetical protein
VDSRCQFATVQNFIASGCARKRLAIATEAIENKPSRGKRHQTRTVSLVAKKLSLSGTFPKCCEVMQKARGFAGGQLIALRTHETP